MTEKQTPVKITATARAVGDHQLDVQEQLIDVEILRLKLNLNAYSSEQTWRMLEEMRNLKEGIRLARREFHLIPTKRRTLWDRAKIAVYHWAVRDRFK